MIPPAAADRVGRRCWPSLRVQPRLAGSRRWARIDAKSVAAWVGARTAVVWAPEGLGEAAALRWKNQVNENAKSPAFSGVLPELDHNEIEGWSAGRGAGFALVILRPAHEAGWVGRRVTATLAAVAGSGLDAHEVWAARARPMSRCSR